MNWSLVIICPAALRETVRAAAEAQGLGPNNIACPVSDSGDTLTHYGSRAWASDGFKQAFNDTWPEELRAVCIIDWREDGPDVAAQHWADVLAANNMTVIEDAE